jgi:hypothetical protein
MLLCGVLRVGGRVARDATMRALESAVVHKRGENLWECVIDGAGIGNSVEHEGDVRTDCARHTTLSQVLL